jgi:hypothetical protein
LEKDNLFFGSPINKSKTINTIWIDDPVYQGFVLPGYCEAKQQVQELAAQLRSRGINSDVLFK